MGADIGELVEKAKIVAEATGRDEADVLEDLLDDGIANLTAGKYDFHWIAIWTDGYGEQRLLEENWLDIEITG